MDQSIWERIKTARKYQQKALMALFPEHVSGHLEVIGRECDAIFAECAADLMRGCQDRKNESQAQEKESGARHVTIE